jgi:hypothetical protein
MRFNGSRLGRWIRRRARGTMSVPSSRNTLMPVSLHDASVGTFVRMLTNLDAILDKAALHAEQKKIDPAVLLNARLYPDMFPLTRQVQIACDMAKSGAGRLAGAELPKHPDTEATFAELKARIAKVIAYVNGLDRGAIEAGEQRAITVPLRDRTLEFRSGLPYLLGWVLPNFYFHVTTAYNILRHNGLEIGKPDYLGRSG